jgi:hypothetical protein
LADELKTLFEGSEPARVGEIALSPKRQSDPVTRGPDPPEKRSFSGG